MGIFLLVAGKHGLKIKTVFRGQSMLQIVLFRAWLNLQYPHLSTPIGPLIDKLREEEKRADAGMPPMDRVSYEELYRLAFGPRVDFTWFRPGS